mgnify:CR=1 FL=1
MSETQRSVFVQYYVATTLVAAVLVTSLVGAVGLVYGDVVPPYVGAAGAWAIGMATGRYAVPLLKEAFPLDD